MPMYRAFAPFLEGDKGDIRVTSVLSEQMVPMLLFQDVL
jgi:hypothetical protein